MRNIVSMFLCLAALLWSGLVDAQVQSKMSRYGTEYPAANEIKYTIYAADYDEARQKMSAFLKAKNYFIINQNETDDAHHFEFTVTESAIGTVDSVCNALGYVSSKVLNFYNNEAKLDETTLELERLELLKKDYEIMLDRIDSVGSDRFYTHWEKIRQIDADIFDARKQIKQLQMVQYAYTVKLDIHNEQGAPGSSKVSFIHMPGAEYVVQFTENPTPGVSFDRYEGVFLKYLFTQGRSYFGLGALKATAKTSSDTIAYNEVFSLIFGQDWYSRHFGRGKNKLLNPYIGYQVGYSIANSPHDIKNIPFASPSFGIELLKTKYLLLDTNASYYLPLTSLNRSLRALRVGASLNFVF